MTPPQLPTSLRWDHNAHHHGWVETQIPPGATTLLDVGCGTGQLARRLAARVEQVDGLDVSPAMIVAARAGGAPGVRWLAGDVLSDLPDLLDGYDVVTAVSSVHHMPIGPALARLGRLVRPGGVLAVVGLHRPVTTDRLLALVTVPANTAVGAVLAAQGRGGRPHVGMPVVQPTATLRQVREAAAVHLPGAQVRRALFWRHLLRWRRPDEDGERSGRRGRHANNERQVRRPPSRP